MTMDLDRRSFLQLLGMAGTAVVMPVGLIPAAAESVEPAVEPFEPLTVENIVLSVWNGETWVPVCGVSSLTVMRDKPDLYISGCGRRQYVGIETTHVGEVQITGRVLYTRYDLLREIFDAGRGRFRVGGDYFEIDFDGYPAEFRHTICSDRPWLETELGIKVLEPAPNTGFDFGRIYHRDHPDWP